MREELDSVLGSRSDVNYEDLAELKYTNCVFKEVLRLWPPVTAVSRVTPDDYKINEYVVPKGTWIQVGPYHSGRSEENFTNPLEFQPERFLKETNNEENNQNYTFFPFSLGPRNCIGQNFVSRIYFYLVLIFLNYIYFKAQV
jgi:cholesterol 24-hydroxylase